MAVNIEVPPTVVSVPLVNDMLRLRDLLDMAEALDGEPEENFLVIDLAAGELRYEKTVR